MTLPPHATQRGSSPTFTDQTLPKALQEAHQLPAGRWAQLELLSGSVVFFELDSGEEHLLEAPCKHTVAPESPHRVSASEGTQLRLLFFDVAEES